MTRFLTGLAVLFLVAAVPAAGQRPPSSPLAGDTRLERKITLARGRIYLGELLERLSTETSVRLQASDRLAPVSGYELTVYVRERPARDVLQALARLYDAPPDRWYWEREARGGKPVYTLKHTLNPEALRAAQEEEAQRRLRAHYAQIAEFYALPQERRDALAARDPYLHPYNNPRAQAMFSLLSGLPAAERESVMSGHRLDLPVERLSPQQQAFVQDYYRSANVGGDPPERISLRHNTLPWTSVIFQIGNAGGGGIIGGARLENEMQAWARGLGSAGGEERPPDRMVPAPGVEARPEELALRGVTKDVALLRLGRLGRVDLLFDHAVAVKAETFRMDRGLDGRLPEVLKNLERTTLSWKWRDNFALFRDAHWPRARRSGSVPWPLRRELRASARGNGGYLRLPDWLRLAALEREQLERLGEEFPDAGIVRQFQIPLRLVAGMSKEERAAAARDEGAGWTEFSSATRQRLVALFTPQEARKARILFQWRGDEKPPGVRLYVDAGDGVPRARTLPLRPWREEKPEPTEP
jgi:hypothetical protein